MQGIKVACIVFLSFGILVFPSGPFTVCHTFMFLVLFTLCIASASIRLANNLRNFTSLFIISRNFVISRSNFCPKVCPLILCRFYLMCWLVC